MTSLIFSARYEIDLGSDLEHLDTKFFVSGRKLNIGRQSSGLHRETETKAPEPRYPQVRSRWLLRGLRYVVIRVAAFMPMEMRKANEQ